MAKVDPRLENIRIVVVDTPEPIEDETTFLLRLLARSRGCNSIEEYAMDLRDRILAQKQAEAEAREKAGE